MAATLAAVLARRGRIVIAVLATLGCAGAAAATAGTEAKPTAFNVRVTSSFARHHITHVVRKKDETGCRFRNDIDTRQTIKASTREPVRMTVAEILRGGKGIVGLRATEKRTGTYWIGWEEGCPLLATQPASRSTTTGCGTTRSFYISNSLTGVGFAGAGKFRLMYAGGEPDPFGVRCLPEFYGGEAGLGSVILGFPPADWQHGAKKRKWWTPLSRAKLLSGKPVVVRWKGSGTVSVPGTLDPAGYDESVYRDDYFVSWTVTLTPTK
jgi:hypothetical protein